MDFVSTAQDDNFLGTDEDDTFTFDVTGGLDVAHGRGGYDALILGSFASRIYGLITVSDDGYFGVLVRGQSNDLRNPALTFSGIERIVLDSDPAYDTQIDLTLAGRDAATSLELVANSSGNDSLSIFTDNIPNIDVTVDSTGRLTTDGIVADGFERYSVYLAEGVNRVSNTSDAQVSVIASGTRDIIQGVDRIGFGLTDRVSDVSLIIEDGQGSFDDGGLFSKPFETGVGFSGGKGTNVVVTDSQMTFGGGQGNDSFTVDYTDWTVDTRVSLIFYRSSGSLSGTVRESIADLLSFNSFRPSRDSVTIMLGSGNDDAYTLDIGLSRETATIDGGEGFDRIQISGASGTPDSPGVRMIVAGNTIALASGFAVTNFEAVRIGGSNHDDHFVSLNAPSNVAGDSFFGGRGRDTLSYDNAVGGITLSLAATAAQDTGGGGLDTLNSIESIIGSAFNDQIIGNAATNAVEGGAGDDRIDTRGGSDFLLGGDGDDVLLGGVGNDRLTGGRGADTLTGGADKDLFIFTSLDDFAGGGALDRITDFSQADDLIDLSAIDTDPLTAGDQGFTMIGRQAFTATAGRAELRYEQAADGYLLVQLDVDADGSADASFLVHSVKLNPIDFFL